MSIPIFMISYANSRIEESIISLVTSTKADFNLCIVNNSGPKSNHASLLARLSEVYGFSIIHSLNLWVLSLNNHLIQQVMNQSNYYIVTDDDILFPNGDKDDWLEYLLARMDQYFFIGKISLSLSWSPSQADPPSPDIPFPMSIKQLLNVKEILPGLRSFTGDTTPAIYRSRLFSPSNNFFSPRHQKLIRPDLHACVTTLFTCTSLSNTVFNVYPESYIRDKALCFGLVSAYLSKDNLQRTPLVPKLFYLLARPLANSFWIIHLFICHLLFLLNFLIFR